jgi:5'-nucleotidase
MGKIELKNLLIPKKKDFEKKLANFRLDGKDRIHVLADFDRTLTKAFVNGISTPSVISELRKGDYISEEYAEKAQELADRYHPMEIDPLLSFEEKKEAMNEWWNEHFDLLIESGLNIKHIKQIIDEGKIEFREGIVEFLELLHKNNIPLIIVSSSGLGWDSISMFFEKKDLLYPNVHIVSNRYSWDEDGNAIGVKRPIIHVMNKDETVLEDFPFFSQIKDRKNVLLLGDSLGDPGMVEGFNYENLIKIGFLNENIKENLDAYKKEFDVLLLNDTGMGFVTGLLKNIN